MKMHRFARFSSTHALCGIDYTTVCDRQDAYVLSDTDERRFPLTCSGCIAAKSSLRASPSAQLEAVRSPLPPSLGWSEVRRTDCDLLMAADGLALGVADRSSCRPATASDYQDASDAVVRGVFDSTEAA